MLLDLTEQKEVRFTPVTTTGIRKMKFLCLIWAMYRENKKQWRIFSSAICCTKNKQRFFIYTIRLSTGRFLWNWPQWNKKMKPTKKNFLLYCFHTACCPTTHR